MTQEVLENGDKSDKKGKETKILHETEKINKIEILDSNDHILMKIVNYMRTNLNKNLLTEMNDKIRCINNFCRGDGCGLTSGALIDIFITKFLSKNLLEFKEYHNNESDCTICNERISFKKISGKSNIALNWSKNSSNDVKEKFSNNIMIINLKTCKWWKMKYPIIFGEQINFGITIPAGIFIIDKNYCRYKVMLSSNNKTNSLIDSKYLYMMLIDSMRRDMFIKLPKESKKYTFDICLSFVE